MSDIAIPDNLDEITEAFQVMGWDVLQTTEMQRTKPGFYDLIVSKRELTIGVYVGEREDGPRNDEQISFRSAHWQMDYGDANDWRDCYELTERALKED